VRYGMVVSGVVWRGSVTHTQLPHEAQASCPVLWGYAALGANIHLYLAARDVREILIVEPLASVVGILTHVTRRHDPFL
jgi:hypothetical protein